DLAASPCRLFTGQLRDLLHDGFGQSLLGLACVGPRLQACISRFTVAVPPQIGRSWASDVSLTHRQRHIACTLVHLDEGLLLLLCDGLVHAPSEFLRMVPHTKPLAS